MLDNLQTSHPKQDQGPTYSICSLNYKEFSEENNNMILRGHKHQELKLIVQLTKITCQQG